MPYIQCRNRKSWSKVNTDICFQIDEGKPCPHLQVTDKSEKELDIKCTYTKGGKKKREKKTDRVANNGSAPRIPSA